MLLVIAILLVLVLIGIARCIVIVPQSNAYVTEWLGVYKDTWGAGLHLRTPFVERVSRKVSLKEEAADFPPQPVITRDNVTMMIDTVVFFQVFDAKLFGLPMTSPGRSFWMSSKPPASQQQPGLVPTSFFARWPWILWRSIFRRMKTGYASPSWTR